MTQPRTFVLIHGGFGGSWSWTRLAPLLRGAGHRVFTPTLTGVADRSHLRTPQTGLSTHIEDVVQLIKWEGLTDVVLAGHSYGGMVITGVADRIPERIGHLVYLDAAQPSDGQGLIDIAPQSMHYAAQTLRPIDGVDVVGGNTFEELGLASARSLPELPEDPTEEQIQEWVDAHDSPFPWKAFTEKLDLHDEKTVQGLPRASVNTTWSLQSEPESDAARRRMVADSVWEVNSGHNLQILAPHDVADILLSL